jgi:hypothetical protein
VRESERHGHSNCGAAASATAGSRRHYCGFLSRAIVDRDGLSDNESGRDGDRDNSLACSRRDANRRGSSRTNRCDNGGLDVDARIDDESLTGTKICDARNLNIVHAEGRRSCQGGHWLYPKIGTQRIRVATIRETAHASAGRTWCWSRTATPAIRGHGHDNDAASLALIGFENSNLRTGNTAVRARTALL